MNAYISGLGVFLVVLALYLSWLSRHFFTFGASRWQRTCPHMHHEEYRVQLLVHNKERIPLEGEHIISFKPTEGGVLHLGDATIFCGNARVKSITANGGLWEVEFLRIPPEDTWAFEFSVDSDVPISVAIRPASSPRHPLARLIGDIGQNKMQIKSGVRADFFPNNRRPTILACATISSLALALYFLVIGLDPTGIEQLPIEKTGMLARFLAGAIFFTAIFTFLLSIRVASAPISRAYSEPTRHAIEKARAHDPPASTSGGTAPHA